MREVLSKLLEPFRDQHHRERPPPLRASTTGRNAGEGDPFNTRQGKEEVASDKTNTKKPSAVGPSSRSLLVKTLDELDDLQRKTLNELSMLRAKPSAINVTPSGGSKSGGKAKVVQATFKGRLWRRRERVIVKKLRFNRGMDSRIFANVRR